MEGTDSRRRRSIVEQLAGKTGPRHEPEVEEAMEAFQEARAKSREALMLDVRLTDGTIESFDYASLRRVKYSPDGTLTLRFGRDKIVAEGKNLERLRCAISSACRSTVRRPPLARMRALGNSCWTVVTSALTLMGRLPG